MFVGEEGYEAQCDFLGGEDGGLKSYPYVFLGSLAAVFW